MSTEKSQTSIASSPAAADHIDEFVNASMAEHKTCFQKTISKMFSMSKVVAQRNADNKEVESSLSLHTVVSD
ncbi:hypothetical protein Tco_0110580 [Tanacetum coccineum]